MTPNHPFQAGGVLQLVAEAFHQLVAEAFQPRRATVYPKIAAESPSSRGAPQAGVQDVSQGVAEEIEAEYGQAEGGAGSKQKPGSVEEVLAVPVRQVHSPRRRSDGDAVTE